MMPGLSRAYRAVLVMLAAVAGIIIAAITVAVPIDAIGRYLFAKSIYGLVDLVENGLMAAVLLATPWVLSRGEHVTVDVAFAALARGPQRILHIVVCLIGMTGSAIMVWYGGEAIALAVKHGTMVRKNLAFPESWTFVPLVICFALTTVEFGRQMLASPKPTASMSH